MQESAKLFYAGASPVRNSILGQWHSWLAHSPDKTEVDGSNPSCPTNSEDCWSGLTALFAKQMEY